MGDARGGAKVAGWITHTIIADNLLERGLGLDARGFCVGNIAPDCNVENHDFTDFTPSREVTHFMRGRSKQTADYEGFYDKYIEGADFDSDEHRSFLLGYYSHLITDVEFQKYVRDEKRVRGAFERVRASADARKMIEGLDENFDTLKRVFGRGVAISNDVSALESRYLRSHPDASYNMILRKTEEFADYLDFLPEGAITRKVMIMAREPIKTGSTEHDGLRLFSEEDFDTFIAATSDIVHNRILGRRER